VPGRGDFFRRPTRDRDRGIPLLVFSLNRACQLDALLRSLGRHAPGLTPVTVLWKAVDDAFRAGYDLCRSEHPDVAFVPESDFRADVLAWLRGKRLCAFAVDDDVVYGPVSREVPAAFDDPVVLAFSLRLGSNCSWCYALNREQPVPALRKADGYVVWDWTTAELDFAYPGSLDLHVFRARDLRAVVSPSSFANPNQLEDVLVRQLGRRAKRRRRPRRLLASYEQSRVFGCPVNRVNASHPNRFATSVALPTESLNNRYLAGERVDLDALDYADIRSAHHELQLVMRPAQDAVPGLMPSLD
jgi:hypothetical protein